MNFISKVTLTLFLALLNANSLFFTSQHASFVDALKFELLAAHVIGVRRCIQQWVSAEVLAVGSFHISDGNYMKVDVEVCI
jgi:hypothetical protein